MSREVPPLISPFPLAHLMASSSSVMRLITGGSPFPLAHLMASSSSVMRLITGGSPFPLAHLMASSSSVMRLITGGSPFPLAHLMASSSSVMRLITGGSQFPLHYPSSPNGLLKFSNEMGGSYPALAVMRLSTEIAKVTTVQIYRHIYLLYDCQRKTHELCVSVWGCVSVSVCV